MGEYFNEDDLINDYIAHQEEEEPPFDQQFEDDEYMEEPYDDAAGVNKAGVDVGDGGNDGLGGNDAVAGGVGVTTNDNGNAAGTKNDIDALDLKNDNDNDGNAVPQLISTSPLAKSSHRNKNDSGGGDLYGFERYTGLSGWRTKSGNAAAGNATAGGGGSNEGGEKYGATTMEATSWKKKKDAPITNNAGEDDDSLLSDDDDLDGRIRKRAPPDTTTPNCAGRYGASGRGGEAQLVRFREREERNLLGRSWDNVDGQIGGSGVRCVFGNKSLPELGEDSMAVTLADGTRTFVKRKKSGCSTKKKDVDTSTNGESKEAGESNEGEGCLLGLPMSELVRRADILEKRAIRRRVEREARYEKSSSAAENDKNDGAGDGNEEEKDKASQEAAMGDSNEDAKMENDTTDNEAEVKASSQKQQQQKQSTLQKKQKLQMQLQQRLWVDKHAPTSISHLLSDERTNREVLRALRAWDPYVFKKEAPVRPVNAFGNRYGQQWDDNNKSSGKAEGSKQPSYKKEDDTNNDGNKPERVDVRPDETSRCILLSGPPGVGKSTLAHIVCKHAGYRPIEVNASDERSKDALVERVTRAMESGTLDLERMRGGGESEMGTKKGGKPNCIILDEIDGADAKASIAALVEIIRADMPSPNSKGGKKNKGTTYLRRPIILICNHKYAPALRPILPYAKQFDVRPPNPERLAGRLRAVLAAERMSVVAGGMLLHRLVAATGGDVRSCLYALQFASARAREVAAKKREREGLLSNGNKDDGANKKVVVDISSTLMAALGDKGNGMKDMQGDVSSTIAAVFRKTKSRSGGSNASQGGNKRQKTSRSATPATSTKGVDLVLKAVDRFGDNSKTLDCLFMNINRVSYVDPTLDRCCSAFEWLSGADTYRSHRSNVAMNNSAEHMSMQKFYIPSAAAAIHLLCCVETRQDLTFSTRPLSDARYQGEANVSLVHRFVEGLAPRARRGVGGGADTVVSDVIPYGLWLLSAGDGKHALSRPVSSVDILSAEEKLAFSAHVATLRALGLTYVRDESGGEDYKNPNAQAENVRLEPEIEKLVKFDDLNNGDPQAGGGCSRKDIPPLLKELLAHGATVAALRERESEAQIAQQEAVVASGNRKAKEDSTAKPKEVSEKKKPTITPKKQPTKAGSNSSAAKNFLGFRAAKAKKAKTDRRAARVGFDRTKKVKLSNTGSGVELTRVIRFKYQKGFTQAVRAPCQLEDLL